jgi:hypothetical protein
MTLSSDARRLGLFSRQPDGTRHVEEDPYRRLNRFRIFIQHSEPNGDVWITGEKLLRFRARTNGSAPQPFPTVVRQVNAGPRVVFGGTSMAGTSDPRLPPGSNALRFQFAALIYGNPAETEYQYLLEGARRTTAVWVRVIIGSVSARAQTTAAPGKRESTPPRSCPRGTGRRSRMYFMASFSCWLSLPGVSSSGMSGKKPAKRRRRSKLRQRRLKSL